MPKINWIPAQPRKGILGMWDKFVGPGATPAEEWIQLGGGLLLAGGVGMLLHAQRNHLNWSVGQIIVIALLIFDLSGGIITNATSVAKRWYHRAGQEELKAHLPFIVVHGLHIFLIAWLFRSMDWAYLGVMYGYLLMASVMIIKTPLYLQRPVSFTLFCVGYLLGMYVFTPTIGLEWFIPFFYLKLLVSHLVKEAPFTPEGN